MPAVTLRLPANATCDRRMVFYLVSNPPDKMNAGVLEVVEAVSYVASPPVHRKYLLAEVPHQGERKFLVENGDDPATKVSYTVTLSPNGEVYDGCQCRAFQTGKMCVHREAVRGLVAAGHLPEVVKT